VLAGSAEVGLANHESALRRFVAVKDEKDGQMVIHDWYTRMMLESGLTDLALATGDLARARPQGERFLQVTQATAERTWQALAWDANARVWIAAGDVARGKECVDNALATMKGFEVPLAAWRVYATAAG
jgi:hypothetical protein